ncbi:MAG: hypothetical protein AVDCRST_MAG78-247 [uncultured Rubrobacteraceae bacterium]|uniref:Uncharacterized protein n=1 Tax=uncultured Rubrobacteraceae bacterium TaxID=349277 RepID=A0A6J4P829_9ACTN|nr:MAG: hypothetical protein AVDCRST_MAG78-247 [uncultured Rubrobacteraceae bacterium]
MRGLRGEGKGALRTITWPIFPVGRRKRRVRGDHLAGSSW